MIAHHYNRTERALIRHQVNDPREMYAPVRVRCDKRVCLSVAANGVITFFNVRHIHGVYEFRKVGQVA